MEHEFNLDAPIESLEGVPNEYHSYYQQTDAGFEVAESHQHAARTINGLSKNLKTARSSLTRANNESAERRVALSAFDGIYDVFSDIEDRTPEALKSRIEALAKEAANGGKGGEEAAAEIERIKASMTNAHKAEIEGVTSKLEAANSTIRKLMISDGAKSAIVAEDGNPTLLEPLIERECDIRETDEGQQVVVILGPDGNPRYDNAGNLMTIAQRVAELKADKNFAGAFNGRVPGGSDTPTNSKLVTRKTGGADPSEMSAKQKISAGLKRRRGSR